MLNEKLEYDEYTTAIASGCSRLQYESIKGGNGIVRPLTIIARKVLEEKGYFDTYDREKLKIIREEAYNRIDKWCQFEDIKEADRNNEWIGLIDKQNRWQNGNEYASFQGLKNDNSTNFRIIIKNAAELGPLKNRRLVFPIRLLEDINDADLFRYSTDEKTLEAFNNNKTTQTYILRMFMIIASMLLNEECKMRNNRRIDVGFWMRYPGYVKSSHRFDVMMRTDLRKEFESIFSKDRIEEYGFKLVETDRYKKEVGYTYIEEVINKQELDDSLLKKEDEAGLFDYFKYFDEKDKKTGDKECYTVLKYEDDKKLLLTEAKDVFEEAVYKVLNDTKAVEKLLERN